mgnify:CR=1 FL=1
MNHDILLIFMILFALFAMQAVGGYFQIQDYKKAIRRVHKLGNVGIGQKRGGLFNGYLVLIACNADGVITGAEIMDGLTFMAKFRRCESVMGYQLTGTNIAELLAIFRTLDKKQTKHMKGYIQAAEALEMRLREGQLETS